MIDPAKQLAALLLDDQGQVKQELVEDMLVEVVSGKYIFESGSQLYACRQPTLPEMDNGRIVYKRKLFEATKGGIPTRAQLEETAIKAGMFDMAEREKIRALEAMCSRMATARENTRDPRQKVELSANIEEMRQEIVTLRMREEEVFYYAAETRAEESRAGYLVSCCALAGDLLDKPVWGSWEDFQLCTDSRLIFDSRNAFVRAWNGLPIKIIRAIARTGEWRGRWKAAKETGAPIFDGSPSGWDANKRNLAWWSDFYDAVHRHPECPPDETVRDDEALQDWMNQQIAKVKKAANQTATGPKQPRTFLAGDGRRLPSQTIGSETIQVNQPYKVRV